MLLGSFTVCNNPILYSLLTERHKHKQTYLAIHRINWPRGQLIKRDFFLAHSYHSADNFEAWIFIVYQMTCNDQLHKPGVWEFHIWLFLFRDRPNKALHQPHLDIYLVSWTFTPWKGQGNAKSPILHYFHNILPSLRVCPAWHLSRLWKW